MRIVVSSALLLALMVALPSIAPAQSRDDGGHSGYKAQQDEDASVVSTGSHSGQPVNWPDGWVRESDSDTPFQDVAGSQGDDGATAYQQDGDPPPARSTPRVRPRTATPPRRSKARAAVMTVTATPPRPSKVRAAVTTATATARTSEGDGNGEYRYGDTVGLPKAAATIATATRWQFRGLRPQFLFRSLRLDLLQPLWRVGGIRPRHELLHRPADDLPLIVPDRGAEQMECRVSARRFPI